MGFLFKTIYLCLLTATLSLCHQSCAGLSRIRAGESISLNQTLVSENDDFALGFFRPNSSSTNQYVGIWYNRVPLQTVVWVANREKPLKDHSAGALTITGNGNIAVLDAKGGVLWSSNLTNAPSRTYAALLDTGNFVLRAADTDTIIWQSFEHPSYAWLMEMPLQLNISSGVGNRLVSWRDEADPSPGDFSLGVDPETSLQLKIWRGLDTFVRSSVWNGQQLAAGRDVSAAAIFVASIQYDGGIVAETLSTTRGSPPVHIVLDPTGIPFASLWSEKAGNWTKIPVFQPPCALYNRCGPNAFCEINSPLLHCNCMKGFVPRNQEEWNLGNFTGGCTRRTPLACGGGDFLKLERMKLPDHFRLVRNASAVQCRSDCWSNCSCTAYSYSSSSIVGSSSRCLVWIHELIDSSQYGATDSRGEDLYLRVDASEPANNAQTSNSSNKRNIVLAVMLPIGAVMIFFGAYGYIYVKRFKRKGKNKAVVFDDFKDFGVPSVGMKSKKLPVLDFNTLLSATGNFSSANRLGEGGFGLVYKGKLWRGTEVAIKRLSKCSKQGFEEFKNEVELIARLQHTHLVRLLGWCIHDDEKILIYEYMENKSLDKFIFDSERKRELEWGKRLDIIKGIAQGLLYLHRYSRLRIIHRDLKTSNILLDGELRPKIADFGLARILGKNQSQVNTERVVGTFGYMSPEYAFEGLFSEKSDVFSFGVIVLEIVTGKRSTGYYPYKQSFNLLGYAWEHWKERKGLELVDPSIGSEFSESEVMRCIQIGLLCVQEKASSRPTMSSVISMLDTEVAALPSPNQPAFSTGRCSDSLESWSGSSGCPHCRELITSTTVVNDDAP